MNRVLTLVGRGGTVLVAIGLALLLVSLIPASNQSLTQGRMIVTSDDAHIVQIQALTPQLGLQLSISAEGTVDIHLLETSYQELVLEIGNVPPLNTSDFEEYLDANPSLILWNKQITDESYEREYFPPRILNTTLVLSTQSSDFVPVDYSVDLTTTIAPGNKLRNIAIWITPIGLILAIPWLVNLWKQRKQK